MNKTADLFMFMGQSNMAGRGISTSEHPELPPTITDGAGFEFRAVSAPTRLYPMSEPFGKDENNPCGINDGQMKSGSMVTAFTNEYFCGNGKIPVVGVSASKGGSSLSQWQTDSTERYLPDSVERLKKAVGFLEKENYEIRHKYMLWCQGETDADIGTSENDFERMFSKLLDVMFDNGIEKCFMVRIGNCNIEGSFDRYKYIIRLQDKIAATDDRVVMVSHCLEKMRERGLMKDAFHYFQCAYNECGTEAGKNTAQFVMTGKRSVFCD